MSAAAAAPTIDDAAAAATPAKAKGGKKKKLILIGAAVLVLLLAAGGGGVWYLKHKAAAAAAAAAAEGEDGEGAGAAKGAAKDDDHKSAKADPAHPPTFLPLEPFVVNLADKEAERFAQVGITLEVESAGFADQAKAYMPAIRNSILMVLAHKTSQDLIGREGKERLAEEIRRETVRPMGIDIPAPDSMAKKPADEHASAGGHGEAAAPATSAAASTGSAAAASQAKKPAKFAKGLPPPNNPVRHVHFSSFIIQ